MKRICILGVLLAFLPLGTVQAQQKEIPEEKQTTLGLYVTSAEAYQKWKADPDNVKIIDVRTPEEYIFVGHAEMAYNVPLKFLLYQWDAETNKPAMKLNPDFVDQVRRVVKPSDAILVTCRSGKRGVPAADLLAAAGFKNVYHIIDGVEGDKVTDPESVFCGKRMKNGWKNSGLPWTYDLVPALMYLDQKP